MDKAPQFEAPEIFDEDVDWACGILGLPATAFSGTSGNDPRLDVLKANATLDVEACPGSGKTTLLVAKLAILARKWTETRRGICVLSHTNVARREIEKRLGSTAAGQRLLSYPHFIGTIHAFVDEFLAIPWLRSLGYPVRVVDDQLCEEHRRRLLKLQQFSALAYYVKAQEKPALQLNIVSGWRVSSPSFDVIGMGNQVVFKDASKPAAKQLRALARKCAEDGYYRHDEMFMWANHLMQTVPTVQNHVRRRFPMLFIDEVQDNSEDQSAILFRLFMEGQGPVIRQRYGDSNQAIYSSVSDSGSTTDPFPDPGIRRDIPSSHRFSQEIADLADPLGVLPQSLVGWGPRRNGIESDMSGKHSIFVFSDETIQIVLPTYARYLCDIFSEEELRCGEFAVVAGVHRAGKEDNVPRFLGHYWPDYDSDLTASEPKPNTFFQYITAGRARAEQSGEAYDFIERLAEAIIRLIRLSNPAADLGNRKRKHRHIMELLADKPEAKAEYLTMVSALGPDQAMPSQEEWIGRWQSVITDVAEAASPEPMNSAVSAKFVTWPLSLEPVVGPDSRTRDNFFRYPAENPKVALRVGSIHSVKGQTHTATLVLETFYQRHQLKTLKPWLLGVKSGGHGQGKQNMSRLRQHYVAMTRPSHLLCLAMKEDCLNQEEILQLKNRQWRVARVADSAPVWL